MVRPKTPRTVHNYAIRRCFLARRAIEGSPRRKPWECSATHLHSPKGDTSLRDASSCRVSPSGLKPKCAARPTAYAVGYLLTPSGLRNTDHSRTHNRVIVSCRFRIVLAMLVQATRSGLLTPSGNGASPVRGPWSAEVAIPPRQWRHQGPLEVSDRWPRSAIGRDSTRSIDRSNDSEREAVE